MAGTFALDISKFVNKAKVDTKTAVQKIAMEAFRRVIEKSPVDTGRFRANWGVMVGSPYAGVTDVTDKAGAATAAAMMAAVKGWNGQGSVYLCNNLPYSIPLEYGHSKQAPGGMVRVTIAEMGGVAASVVKS